MTGPVLCLETSTDVCSVAVGAGTILAHEEVYEPQAHATQLALLIEKVLKTAGLTYGDLAAVAVSKGPGSYTGLRIGTSTAKGLCYALDKPLVAVGTLDLLARQMHDQNKQNALLCPMIDARRMEVYCQVSDADLNVIMPPTAVVVDDNSFSELLADSAVLFFGNGAGKCREVINHPNAIFVDDIVPLARTMGPMAADKLAAGEVEDLVGFSPFYLKEFRTTTPRRNP